MGLFRRTGWLKEKEREKSITIPKGVWVKCQGCKEIIYQKEIEMNLHVCPKCSHHFRISSLKRIGSIADEAGFRELDAGLVSTDPLGFRDTKSYKERLEESRENTGLKEAVLYGDALIKGLPVILAVMDFSFMGGSMGSVVGEKITRAAERALERRAPLITVSSSGGARMQEGAFSLMQMAKTSAAVGRLKEAGVLYISILADPTFGGVSASFSMLGDVIIAEPGSLIGFAGPRVIEQTIKQKLPANFQRSEFLCANGQIDLIVHRKELRETLAKLIMNIMPSSRERGTGTVLGALTV